MVIDTETTGLNPETDRVVEIGAAIFNGGVYIHGINYLLKTDVPIPPEVSAINGISQEKLDKEGLDPKLSISRIFSYIHQMSQGKLPIVAFNAIFDFRFLLTEAKRRGIDYNLRETRVIDPLIIDRRYDKWKKGSRKLEAMAPKYGVMPGNHRALNDAIATGYVAIGQGMRWSTVRHQSPLNLHRSQKLWYADWLHQYRSWRQLEGILPIPEMQDWPFGNENKIPLSEDEQCLL
jgi:DNA polymerase III subunit epsilon